MITLNVLRCLSPWVDYLAHASERVWVPGHKPGLESKVSLMGSLELFHLYHHFVAWRAKGARWAFQPSHMSHVTPLPLAYTLSAFFNTCGCTAAC